MASAVNQKRSTVTSLTNGTKVKKENEYVEYVQRNLVVTRTREEEADLAVVCNRHHGDERELEVCLVLM